MTPQPPNADIEQTLADVLASGVRTLCFPRALEAFFETETGARRSQQLVRRGLIGIAFAVLYLAADWVLTPDTFGAALVLRLGVIGPLIVATLFLLLRNPRPMVREGVVGAICVVAFLTTLGLMLSSHSSLRDGHHVSVILFIMFVTMVQRLRFPYAVATCAVCYAAYVVALTSMAGYPAERMFTNSMVFGSATLLALVASYSLEHEFRLAYLLGLRERLRNTDLQTLSQRDPLTGLHNRRSLELALDGMTGIDEDCAVILADIDHFKAYNDSLGHQAGDTCLKRIAGIVQGELRTGADMAVRYGGEEFLILLQDTDLTTATGVAERMRRAIEDAAIPHPARPVPGVVTASFGVTSARLGGVVTADELIASADAGLYGAKRNGRNQVWPRFLSAQHPQVVEIADRKTSGNRSA